MLHPSIRTSLSRTLTPGIRPGQLQIHQTFHTGSWKTVRSWDRWVSRRTLFFEPVKSSKRFCVETNKTPRSRYRLDSINYVAIYTGFGDSTRQCKLPSQARSQPDKKNLQANRQISFFLSQDFAREMICSIISFQAVTRLFRSSVALPSCKRVPVLSFRRRIIGEDWPYGFVYVTSMVRQGGCHATKRGRSSRT